MFTVSIDLFIFNQCNQQKKKIILFFLDIFWMDQATDEHIKDKLNDFTHFQGKYGSTGSHSGLPTWKINVNNLITFKK